MELLKQVRIAAGIFIVDIRQSRFEEIKLGLRRVVSVNVDAAD
jgi:hypothetical protein